MSLYDSERATRTTVIVPCCFVSPTGWVVRHRWRFTHYGKVCDRCGARIVVHVGGGVV